MNSRWISISMAVATVSLGLTACEVKNPIEQNKSQAQAQPPEAQTQALEVVEKSEPAGGKSPTLDPKLRKLDTSKLKLPNKNGQQKLLLNDRVREALQKRAAQADAQREVEEAKGGDAAGGAPKRELTSATFSKLEPDAADTAKKPPVAADLTRYTKDLPGKGKLKATIHTTMGELHCELFEKRAPATVANFVGLSRGLKAWQDPATREAMVGIPLYQNILFHRVIPSFMIQGGDPLGRGTGNPGYSIKDEFHPELKHDKPGLLSMANAGPNTGGSQFFVTEVPTPHLDNRHAIFGRCEEVELVKKIARVPTGAMNRPTEPVMITKIVISRDKK